MEMALSSALAPDSETQERCSSIEQHSQPASQRCRVLIVDDHAIVREGLKQVIHRDPAFMVSAEAACAAHALQQLRHGGIDIVLMDIALPDRDGIEFLKQIKLLTPSLKVLVCSLYQESAYALRALRAGAAGYVGKQCTPGTLLSALHQIANGKKYISDRLAQQLADQLLDDTPLPPHQALSDRKYQTLLKLAAGMSVTEIAMQLALSVKTISVYRARLMIKMRMRKNAELTHYAIRHQLLPEFIDTSVSAAA